MIKTTTIKKGDKVLYKTTSNKFKILQVETGKVFSSAIDVKKNAFTYKETNIPLKVKEQKEKK